ncbi:uncharacterized protein LAESUDRAFT_735536 [Laetiporus sulphureus 93-53]|uniref:Mitochondrial K+-H+ exchange-related-domain-containing protein n=1 Tax=Laetiporus sulphureus 93-53 TaxID=1314785 RepID=A0A165FPM5_9APHY|nr:uncharacterized protein LAESUDRAFT_735536 [Laetiporus sulphureus 93-53]KZT09286.1 hypothetical protein LAESUDRAFT_735536 [Laetiporus sulphureus 93-53]
MRIIALPLATPSLAHRPPEHLTYYHFVTPPPSKSKSNSWSKRVIVKASDLWAGLGRAPEGNWKRKVFVYGERLIDRLDFEELALKSFDTSLGPQLLRLRHTDKLRPRDHPTIPLIYPPTSCASPLPHLRALLEKRTPRHRNGCLIWIAAAPFTIPFMLVPLIPNFPFFYCAWRAWSHYRAFKASQYLEAFVAQGAILPQASPELDTIYAQHAPAPPSPEPKSQVDTSAPPDATFASTSNHWEDKNDGGGAAAAARPHLLLTRAAVPALERLFALPPGSSFAADVYRALEQARIRLEKEGR